MKCDSRWLAGAGSCSGRAAAQARSICSSWNSCHERRRQRAVRRPPGSDGQQQREPVGGQSRGPLPRRRGAHSTSANLPSSATAAAACWSRHPVRRARHRDPDYIMPANFLPTGAGSQLRRRRSDQLTRRCRPTASTRCPGPGALCRMWRPISPARRPAWCAPRPLDRCRRRVLPRGFDHYFITDRRRRSAMLDAGVTRAGHAPAGRSRSTPPARVLPRCAASAFRRSPATRTLRARHHRMRSDAAGVPVHQRGLAVSTDLRCWVVPGRHDGRLSAPPAVGIGDRDDRTITRGPRSECGDLATPVTVEGDGRFPGDVRAAPASVQSAPAPSPTPRGCRIRP